MIWRSSEKDPWSEEFVGHIALRHLGREFEPRRGKCTIQEINGAERGSSLGRLHPVHAESPAAFMFHND